MISAPAINSRDWISSHSDGMENGYALSGTREGADVHWFEVGLIRGLVSWAIDRGCPWTRRGSSSLRNGRSMPPAHES